MASAYTELQNRHRWRWLKKGFTLSTSGSDGEYAFGDATDTATASAITRFRSWDVKDRYDPPRIYLTSAGIGSEGILSYVAWEDFKMMYRIGTRIEGYPAHISVDPNNNIQLGPIPDAAYTITSEYHMSPQILAADATVPELPVQFHMLLVYRAMEDIGYFDVAQEIIERSRVKGRRLLRQLENDQLEPIRMAGAMV